VRQPRLLAIAAGVAGLAVLALCRAAMLPGVGYWDTAELQTVGPVLGVAHPTGFPAWVVVGWLASVVLQPFGDPALRMNLLSGLLVAGAVSVTVVLGRILTRSTSLGVAAGLGLGTTALVWRIGTFADVHALHLLLLAGLLLALVAWQRERARGGGDRWLVAASAVFGLSLANHSLTLLLALPVGLYVLSVERRLWQRGRLVALCAGVLIGTAAVLYLELPLRAGPFRAPLVYGTPETWDGFRYIVLGEQFRGSIVDPFGELSRKLRELVDLAAAQLGPLAGLVPIGFLVTAVRDPRYALLTGLAAAITVFFAASYVNADIGRYYVGPILIAWTWLAILAAAVADAVAGLVQPRAVDESRATARDVPAPGLDARPLAALGLAAALLVPTAADLGSRAAAVDRSADTSAGQWLDATIDRLEPDAVVISWWSYSTPLWYAQHVEGRLPGVLIADDRTRLDQQLGEVSDVIQRHLGRQPVYLIRSSAGELRQLARTYQLDPGPVPNELVQVVGPLAADG